MKKQPKKLTLKKETLRDLTAPNAGEVKGGRLTAGKKCPPASYTCFFTCKGTEYCPTVNYHTICCPKL